MWTLINGWKNRDEWKVPPPDPPSEAYMHGWITYYWSGIPKSTLGIYEDPCGRKWIDIGTLVEYDGYPRRKCPERVQAARRAYPEARLFGNPLSDWELIG